MTDARCKRCQEKKVGVTDIIHAGNADRYQVLAFLLVTLQLFKIMLYVLYVSCVSNMLVHHKQKAYLSIVETVFWFLFSTFELAHTLDFQIHVFSESLMLFLCL